MTELKSRILVLEKSGVDIKSLKIGDQFYITDEASGGTDWILDESLVEFNGLSETGRKLNVTVLKKTGGYNHSIEMSHPGAKITVSPRLCFSRSKDDYCYTFVDK